MVTDTQAKILTLVMKTKVDIVYYQHQKNGKVSHYKHKIYCSQPEVKTQKGGYEDKSFKFKQEKGV